MTSNNLNSIFMDKKRSEWLKEIHAHLVDGYEVTEYGKSRIKTVSFIDQEAPLSILAHIWDEYDVYAEATLEWLCELGEHPSFEVRLRAAAVVGQLAIYEFRPVRDKIISPWAKSKKQTLQKLAALALSVVAYDEDETIAQQALKLLHHWSGLPNSPRLHRTAIAAYGGYIGLLFPEEALDNLKIIAQSGDGRWFSDIAQAVAVLFNLGQKVPDLHLLVLNALKEWVQQGKQTSLHRLSLVIFWGLMRESWIVKNDVRQPTLLFLAKEIEECEDVIIYLLRNALNLQSTRDLVLIEILNWLKFVDKKKILYKTIEKKLNRWKRPQSPKPGTAFVFVGDGKPSRVVYEGEKTLTQGEVFWGGYKTYYEVDLGDRSISFEETLPCSDGLEFQAEVKEDPI